MKNGEIWLVNLSPSVGDEIASLRPAVIVSNDVMGALRLKMVVPITNAQKVLRGWHVRVKPSQSNGLRKESFIDCFQLKSLAYQRFQRKIGILATKDMDSVKLCVSEMLDLL